MKQLYKHTKTCFNRVILINLLVLLSFTSFSQTVPELVFKNPTRTGTDGAVGTVYKFATVTTGIDALVKISAKSDNNVSLENIDLSNTGFDNSFQPQVTYNNGDVPKNTTWWMEFTISFVKNSDNTIPQTVSGFSVTGLDIDGDGDKLKEELTFYGLDSYTLENPTLLTISNVVNGKTFTAPYTNYDNINTSETKVMVTNKYVNTYSFKVRIGGRTGNSSSSAGERMSSLWFKSFTYSNPVNLVLPVNLLSFTAKQSAKSVVLDWVTSTEKNFSHFAVQSSTDGSSFKDNALVFSDATATGATKSYSYSDLSASSAPVVYYRLKMVDVDGQFDYSEVRVIRNTKVQDEVSMSLFPNPAVNDLKVTIPSNWQNKSVTYSIYDSNGNLVKQKLNSNAAQTEVLYLSGMKAGIYVLKVGTSEQTIVKQFVKQN